MFLRLTTSDNLFTGFRLRRLMAINMRIKIIAKVTIAGSTSPNNGAGDDVADGVGVPVDIGVEVDAGIGVAVEVGDDVAVGV